MAHISDNPDDPLADAEAAGEIGAEEPEADAVDQRTPADGGDDGDEATEAWSRVPDEVDPADATEQRRGAGPLDADDYREA